MRERLKSILMISILLLAVLQAAGVPVPYNFRSLSVSDGLSDLVVNACYKDRQGFVWFGTNVSLERFDGVRLKHYLIKGKSENLKRVYAIAETQGNELWVGADVGLLRLDKASGQLVAIDPTQIIRRYIACSRTGKRRCTSVRGKACSSIRRVSWSISCPIRMCFRNGMKCGD